MSAGETGGKIVVGLIQNIFINTLIKRPAHLANSIRGLQEFTNIDSLDKRVTSLIKTILKTADAAEDSGVIPIDAYDIGKNIAENIEERSD